MFVLVCTGSLASLNLRVQSQLTSVRLTMYANLWRLAVAESKTTFAEESSAFHVYFQDTTRLLMLKTVSLLHCFLQGEDFLFIIGIAISAFISCSKGCNSWGSYKLV